MPDDAMMTLCASQHLAHSAERLALMLSAAKRGGRRLRSLNSYPEPPRKGIGVERLENEPWLLAHRA